MRTTTYHELLERLDRIDRLVAGHLDYDSYEYREYEREMNSIKSTIKSEILKNDINVLFNKLDKIFGDKH